MLIQLEEPHLTPATNFLLVLQKKISDLVYGPEFLVKYLELIFSHSKQLLLLLNDKNISGSSKISIDLLKSTIVECVLKKLLKKLSHNRYSLQIYHLTVIFICLIFYALSFDHSANILVLQLKSSN